MGGGGAGQHMLHPRALSPGLGCQHTGPFSQRQGQAFLLGSNALELVLKNAVGFPELSLCSYILLPTALSKWKRAKREKGK